MFDLKLCLYEWLYRGELSKSAKFLPNLFVPKRGDVHAVNRFFYVYLPVRSNRPILRYKFENKDLF